MTEDNGKRHPVQAGKQFHNLSWPARASVLLLLLVVAFLLVRSLGEGGRARHAAEDAVDKSNANALTIDQVRSQIQAFGKTFCKQQGAFAGLPTAFPSPSSAVGSQLINSIVTIQQSGQEIKIQLRCPNPLPSGSATPSPSPGG